MRHGIGELRVRGTGWWHGSLPATTEPPPHGPVNETSAPVAIDRSHAEHNRSGLPSIATDARTLTLLKSAQKQTFDFYNRSDTAPLRRRGHLPHDVACRAGRLQLPPTSADRRPRRHDPGGIPLRPSATNHNAADNTPMAQTAAQDSRMHTSAEHRRPVGRSPEVAGPPRPAFGPGRERGPLRSQRAQAGRTPRAEPALGTRVRNMSALHRTEVRESRPQRQARQSRQLLRRQVRRYAWYMLLSLIRP